MNTFQELGLSQALLDALDALNFTTPTPIQAESIPLALEGHDILGSAQTGTGKTFAFAIPLIEFLVKNTKNSALILLPTRELALQVQKAVASLTTGNASLQSVLLIGGVAMGGQLQSLKRHPRLIIGTPGRINDHLQRRSLSLLKTGFLVLDETDRMLDMGFGPQLETIHKAIQEKPQTLMFSATYPKTIMKLAGAYLHEPQRITVGAVDKPMERIAEENFKVADAEKYGILADRAEAVNTSFIVFVKTKHGAEKLATRLRIDGLTADCLHGDLKQRQRDRVTQNFRDFKFQILVATDVAARGLDIPHIDTVVNYDLPPNPEDYIHRIGRTGRAGREGVALNFISNDDARKWRDIQKLIYPDAKLDPLPPLSKKDKPARKNPRDRGRNAHKIDDRVSVKSVEFKGEKSFRSEKPFRAEKPFRSEGPSRAAEGDGGKGNKRRSFTRRKSMRDAA